MAPSWYFEEECDQMVQMECARCRGTGLPEFVDRRVVEAIYAAREAFTAHFA